MLNHRRVFYFRQSPALKRFTEKHPRRIGAITLLWGVILFIAFVWFPLFQINHHGHDVTVSLEATVVAIATMAIGGLQIVLGRRLSKLIEPSAGGSRVAAIVIVLIAAQAGFMSHRALKQHLERQGYRSTGPNWQFETYQYPAA